MKYYFFDIFEHNLNLFIMKKIIFFLIIAFSYNINAQPLKDLVTETTKEVLKRFENGELQQVELPIYIYERLKKLESNTEISPLFFDGIAPYKVFKDNKDKYYLF